MEMIKVDVTSFPTTQHLSKTVVGKATNQRHAQKWKVCAGLRIEAI